VAGRGPNSSGRPTQWSRSWLPCGSPTPGLHGYSRGRYQEIVGILLTVFAVQLSDDLSCLADGFIRTPAGRAGLSPRSPGAVAPGLAERPCGASTTRPGRGAVGRADCAGDVYGVWY